MEKKEKATNVNENTEEMDLPVKSEDVILNEANSEFDEFFGDVDYEENSAVSSRAGDEEIFTNLGYSVQRIEYDRGAGKRNRFAVVFTADFNGSESILQMNLIPTNVNSKMLHDIVAKIYGDRKKLPLEIVKTTSERNNKKYVRYSCAISYIGSGGIPIRFPFSFSSSEDRFAFEALRDKLIAAGRLK